MEKTIQQLRNQLNDYWQEADKKKKVKLITIGVIIILSIVILTLIFARTKYEVLYQDLSLKDMSEITKKLDELGIPWKTPSKDDTTTILVPADIKNKVKIELASYGLPKEGYSFLDAFNDTSWTMTDYDKKQRMKLALQSELSATISEIDGIESATVYINEKEDTGFVLSDYGSETTASVKITRSDNRPLKGETVLAIQHLVASSINTVPENVHIIDNEGKLLTGEQDESEILMTDQLNIKNNIEIRINDSLKRFLENVFGAGNVDVRSSVKINFDTERTTIVEFNPPIEGNEEGLIRSMEEVEEYVIDGQAGGVPGRETNPEEIEDYAMEDERGERYSKRSRIINYELDEINREIRRAPGQVESITVAVLINRDVLVDGELTQEREEDIAELIYAATGLDTRQVTVMAESFGAQDIDDRVEDIRELNWLAIILALAGLSAVAGYVIYNRRKKSRLEELKEDIEEAAIIEPEVEDLEFETEESKMKSQIDKLVDKRPEAVAQLLRTWLNE